jgi:hypothetical protein
MFDCETEEETEQALSPTERVKKAVARTPSMMEDISRDIDREVLSAMKNEMTVDEAILDADDATAVVTAPNMPTVKINHLVKEHMMNHLTRKRNKVLYLKKGEETIAFFPEIKGRDEDYCGACTKDGFMDMNIEHVYPESAVADTTEALTAILSQFSLRKVLSYSSYQKDRRWSKYG